MARRIALCARAVLPSITNSVMHCTRNAHLRCAVLCARWCTHVPSTNSTLLHSPLLSPPLYSTLRLFLFCILLYLPLCASQIMIHSPCCASEPSRCAKPICWYSAAASGLLTPSSRPCRDVVCVCLRRTHTILAMMLFLFKDG